MSAPWLSPHWLAALFRKPRRTKPNAKLCRVRLELERLEDRDVPTTFNLSGTTLTIYGTPVNDNFVFAKSTTVSGGIVSTTYTFTMDDQQMTYTDAQVKNVNVYGLGGYDTAVVYLNDTFVNNNFPGQSQQLPFTAVATAGGGYVLDNTGKAFMSFSGFQNSSSYLPDQVTGYLYTPPFNKIASNFPSLLVTAANYSYVSGNGQFHLVSGGKAVYGYSTNVTDQAYHYDEGSKSTFVASGDAYSYMSGADGIPYFNVAVGFKTVYAFATPGIGDVAYFYDSPGNDSFVGNTTISYLSGNTGGNAYIDVAEGFGHVYAESFVGGLDFAYNFDASVNTVIGSFVLIPLGARNGGARNG
jgi:hypothetical protein